MCTNCEPLVIWWVLHTFNPFSWVLENSNDLLEVVIIKNGDITLVVGNCNVGMESWVSNSSTLLMSWEVTQCWGGWSDFVGGIAASIIVLISGPDSTTSCNFSLSNADFVEFVVISWGKEGSILWNDFKTPAFSIAMSDILNLLISSIEVNSNNVSIVVAKQNLLIQNINWRCKVLDLTIDLSDKFKLASLSWVNSNFVVFSTWNKIVFMACNSCTFSLMSL